MAIFEQSFSTYLDTSALCLRASLNSGFTNKKAQKCKKKKMALTRLSKGHWFSAGQWSEKAEYCLIRSQWDLECWITQDFLVLSCHLTFVTPLLSIHPRSEWQHLYFSLEFSADLAEFNYLAHIREAVWHIVSSHVSTWVPTELQLHWSLAPSKSIQLSFHFVI